MNVGIVVFGRRCGGGGRRSGFGEAGEVRGGEGGREMVGSHAIDGYIVESLHVSGGYAHVGRIGAVDSRVRIVRRGWGLRGVGVLGLLRLGVGVLETKGVRKRIRGGEIVI